MPIKMKRAAYADMFGPTTGDRVRLADTDLIVDVIDVAAGDKIPSKGGPGIARSDLLVINKIDLAPYVGVSLEVMEGNAKENAWGTAVCVHQSARGQGRRRDRAVH